MNIKLKNMLQRLLEAGSITQEVAEREQSKNAAIIEAESTWLDDDYGRTCHSDDVLGGLVMDGEISREAAVLERSKIFDLYHAEHPPTYGFGGCTIAALAAT